MRALTRITAAARRRAGRRGRGGLHPGLAEDARRKGENRVDS